MSYRDNYNLIEWKPLPEEERKKERKRSAFNVISDYLPDLIHPCTGKRMDSKSEFRKVTKAKGGIEVGNEVQKDRRDWRVGGLERDLMRAMRGELT
jgi:hypothetical protein